MQTLTAGVPKPMLEVRKKPILAHLIANLKTAGLRRILIITGYCAEQIEAYFARESDVSFRRQEVCDGTARAAELARDFTREEPFLLTYGDILVAPEAYRETANRMGSNEAVLAVKYVDDPYQGAAVYIAGDRVSDIIEKPPRGTSTTHWNSAGLYCFRPSIFEQLAGVPVSPRGEYELTDAIRTLLAKGLPVGYYPIPGWWRDVGRPEDLAAAEQMLAFPDDASPG